VSDVARYNKGNSGIGEKVAPVGGNSHIGTTPSRIGPTGGNTPTGEQKNEGLPTGGNMVQGAKVTHVLGGKG
jgi:hypothetical protein